MISLQDNVKVTNVDAHRVEAQALDRSESCIDPSDQVKEDCQKNLFKKVLQTPRGAALFTLILWQIMLELISHTLSQGKMSSEKRVQTF